MRGPKECTAGFLPHSWLRATGKVDIGFVHPRIIDDVGIICLSGG